MTDTPTSKPVISAHNLNVTYFLGHKNEVRALQNVTLDIYPGEFVIFFGPSGCGKSTLLYSIAGLETHAQGNIVVDGLSIAKMTGRQAAEFRQKKVGLVFQAFYLIPSLSVLKNVMLPQMAIRAGAADRLKRARSLLEHFGVAEQAQKLPSELSGGQQQRIAICRALVNDPDIVLADEPVGNLDSKSSADVMQLISELNTRQGKTVILVTHDPAHLHLAHRVFYMRDGQIIDTKVNRPLEPETPAVEQRPAISRDLELLLRTFTSIQVGQAGSLLIPFKAKEIVMESLIGLSAEEVTTIEHLVEGMLVSGLQGDSLVEFLDKPESLGGLSLDRRTARKLADRIEHVVKEIKQLQDTERRQQTGSANIKAEVAEARQYLLETYGIRLQNTLALQRFDQAIAQRLANRIDLRGFREILDQPLTQRGVGLDRRTARKVAKHFELVMLGKMR